MFYIKQVLEDIVDTAYAGHPKLPYYKRFYVEISPKTLKSKHGDYNCQTRHIRIFNPDRDQDNIIVTTIHELAHHIDNVNRGTSDHSPAFYIEYGRLAKAALDMGIFNLHAFLSATRDARDANKIKKILEGYRPKDNGYKADTVRFIIQNGYDIRDKLKEMGYRWNPSSKVWQKEMDTHNVLAEEQALEQLNAFYTMEDARRMVIGTRSRKEQGKPGSSSGGRK